MKRYAWIIGAFFIVVLLTAAEIKIITNASGYEAKDNVVFAKVHIDENTIITGDMLEVREVGRGAVHPNALKDIGAAASKRADMDIEAGEMLLEAKLSSDMQGLVEAKDKNNRLFSVEFDVDQANGWQLAEGRHVDIIYVPDNSERANQPTAEEGGGKTVTFSNKLQVLKNIRIAGLIDEDGKLVDLSESKNTPRHISFEVTEEQAIFLAYAKRNGKLDLSCIPEK